MKGKSIGYLIKEGFKNVWVNRLMSLASIAVLTSCLFMVGCALMVFLNINALLEKMEDENVVIAFVEDGVQEDKLSTIETNLKNIDNVASVEFISKDEAFKTLIESYGEDSQIFAGIDENPIPDSYKITVKDIEKFSSTVDEIKKVENIQGIRENRELALKLLQIRNVVTITSIVIILVLLLVSLFIVSNTIRVTMYSRRLEISIMKAVGATNNFIRLPFMIEGMVLGIFAGCLSTGLVWGTYRLFESILKRADIDAISSLLSFKDYALYILLAFVAVGIFAGAIGSAVSMSRYLKEQGGVIIEDE